MCGASLNWVIESFAVQHIETSEEKKIKRKSNVPLLTQLEKEALCNVMEHDRQSRERLMCE